MDIDIHRDADVLYRYEEVRYSWGLGQYDDPLPGYNIKIELRELKVIRRTPKGAWIRRWSHNLNTGGERFVRLTARKQYASNTKEEAMVCFIARKKRQIQILSRQLWQAKEALAIVENGGRKVQSPW